MAELETTNKEPQSANDELERMNEELESTNEELQAINDELRERTEDYDRINAYLGTVLGSVRIGIVVLDSSFVIRTWNRGSDDLWGIRGDEGEGQTLFSLDIGLPMEQVNRLVHACMDDSDSHGSGQSFLQSTDGAGRSGAVLLIGGRKTAQTAFSVRFSFR